ncbi:MAG: site-specific recombinase, invertase Pin [Clostridia bacterium]|nr:site-specific recombinase, invertase Pin [Clostridia bacterium]
MRAVAYCRVSTDEKDQMNSLENQIKHYQGLFKENNYEPVKVGMFYRKQGNKEIKQPLEGIFADEGISGTKLKNREAFKYMLECAKRKEFDVIYVKNIARYARSVEDGTKTLKDLKECGVKVIFEDGNLNSFEHELVINLFLSVAQEESRAKSIAVQFGIHKAQQAGKWNSQAPYGYMIVDGYLKIELNEAEIIKKIFELYLNGYGTGKIARWLDSNNILTKTGKKWTQKQVCSILDNPIYTGLQRTHRQQNIDVNRNIIVDVDSNEWIIHKREDLRLISDADFAKVQKQRKMRLEMFSNGHRPSNKHIFSNLLYCGNCGWNMKRKKRHSYIRKNGTTRDIGYEWTCQQNDMYGKARCAYRNALPEDELIKHIKSRIEEIRNDNEYLNMFFEKYMKKYYTIDNLEEQLETINNSIDNLSKKIDLNFNLLAEGIINKDEYKKRNDTLQTELLEFENKKNKLLMFENEINAKKREFEEYCNTLKTIDLNNLSNAELKKIINKITITSTKWLVDNMDKWYIEEFV